MRVNMSNRWIVSTDNPWISISPANGVGAAVCEFKIDSALTAAPRSGVWRKDPSVRFLSHPDRACERTDGLFFLSLYACNRPAHLPLALGLLRDRTWRRACPDCGMD